MWKPVIITAAYIALIGCATSPTSTPVAPLTQAQVQTAVADVQAACVAANQALMLAQAIAHGGALQTVNDVGKYITASCSTADAVAVLAANPTSVQWLNTLSSTISTATALASDTMTVKVVN